MTEVVQGRKGFLEKGAKGNANRRKEFSSLLANFLPNMDAFHLAGVLRLQCPNKEKNGQG